MKRIIILPLFLLTHALFAYNPLWIQIDKQLIKNISKLDRNNPKLVEGYFRVQRIQKCDTTKDNLGFGWTMWTQRVAGGYIGISATFYYYHDSIISYAINPEMPVEKKLRKKYKTWYLNHFAFESGRADITERVR